MPEIAEVRTVARTLNKSLSNKKIIDIDIIYEKIIVGDIGEFKENVLNRTITNVDNYGKWLFICLGDKTIMSHLRMEGKYFIKPTNEEIEKHEHIIFHLNDNTDLRYHDTRKFGRMRLIDTANIYKMPEIEKLGLEPDSKFLTKEYIYENINKKETPIKTLLLDQSIINGLGNIYADEVLYEASINPNRLGSSLSLDDCERIRLSASNIIKKATEEGGTTIRSYTSSLGVTGHYQDFLKVHTKENKPCIRCGTKIRKIRIGGRSSYFCPKCQK